MAFLFLLTHFCLDLRLLWLKTFFACLTMFSSLSIVKYVLNLDFFLPKTNLNAKISNYYNWFEIEKFGSYLTNLVFKYTL